MRPSELVRIHTLLRYRIDAGHRLHPFSSALDRPPRAMFARHRDGVSVFFGETASEAERARLGSIKPAVAFDRPQEISDLLEGPPRGAWEDLELYRFRELPPEGDGATVARHGAHFVVLSGAEPVAWAWSVREHGPAEEGAVETVPSFRGRGFGRQALGAWISHVVRPGKIAYYPVPPGEPAPQALAASLRGERFATTRSFP
ncbi:MAG: hypothetical protein L3K19_06245 [Thermoplasmata archaeon]|nr:hypothetical protein [Thermoplasmata archaeon]